MGLNTHLFYLIFNHLRFCGIARSFLAVLLYGSLEKLCLFMSGQIKLDIKYCPLFIVNLMGYELEIESIVEYFVFLVGLHRSDEDRFKLVFF